METILSHLPDHSRVWIYTASREFTSVETDEITQLGKAFVSNWKAHGSALEADCIVMYGRFIIIAADEQVAGVSGCGIDSSVRFIQELEKKYQVTLLDKLNIAYKNESQEVLVEPMFDFQSKLDSATINAETTVFNNLVENMGGLRNQWEVALKESWHQQLL
ncbi:ABC transporter ATPase [bacterium SCSIO 12643]|nr:ABC transporter ATPase [bacterium SCSIO 12643]